MTRHGFIRCAVAAAFTIVLATGQAFAIGEGSSSEDRERNPEYTKAVELIEAEKYEDAIPLLDRAAAREPKNADVQNYLGYAHRKLKRYDAAMKYYLAALAIEPKHRGANEYLGELYLETGQLAKAEERLAVLDSACFFGCEEYTELKEAIAAYKARTGKGS